MKCRLCGGRDIMTDYDGHIRDGKVCSRTKENIKIYRCRDCGVLWHDPVMHDSQDYYESERYRMELEGSADIEDFYKNHDKESLDKINYTGTEIFRNKIVMDVGCGGGAFLDYIFNVAKTAIGIEPSAVYRQDMRKRGYLTYAYMEEAKEEYRGKTDVITSFDVIEHVEEPLGFLKDIYELLCQGGKAYIGTPTETPVMRQVLGEIYDKKLLFSTQHLWIFNEKSLRHMAGITGFHSASVQYKQRYGLDNFISWMQYKEPGGKTEYSFLSDEMNGIWKYELERLKMSDYILLLLEK